MTLRTLENGLFVVEFSVPEERYAFAAESLKQDPYCYLLENIGSSYDMIMIFGITPEVPDSSYEQFEKFKGAVPLRRISEVLKDRHHPEFLYSTGQINWVRGRYSPESEEKLREMVMQDPRISYTVLTERHWIYSRYRVPEQLAASQIRDKFLSLSPENGLLFIPVLNSIKDPGILDDELKKLLLKQKDKNDA